MKQFIIFGTGDLADLIMHLLGEKQDQVAAFVLDKEYIKKDNFYSKPVVAFEDSLKLYPQDKFDIFCAVGYKYMRKRKEVYNRIKESGYKLINIIGKQAICSSNIKLGDNNLIFNGAYIGPDGNIGNNNIFRPMLYLGHLHSVGSHNYFAPGCNIGGNCNIGDLNFIGIGSTVIDSRKIGDEVLIGAGSVITSDCQSQALYAGNPGKIKRYHKEKGIIIKG